MDWNGLLTSLFVVTSPMPSRQDSALHFFSQISAASAPLRETFSAPPWSSENLCVRVIPIVPIARGSLLAN